MRIREALYNTTKALMAAAHEEAAQQSRLLLCHALGLKGPHELMLLLNQEFPPEKFSILDEAIQKRKAGIPLQYILGEWEFMGLPFFVSENTLIPRQDTETLASHAKELIEQNGFSSLLDLCCGGGCVGLSLARLTGVRATLSDISDDAVRLAQKNAELLCQNAAIEKGDLFENIHGTFDIITCNPPYIRTDELASLQREVRHEPALALDGGRDGLHFYRRIQKSFRSYLNDGGRLLLEVGVHQSRAVMELFECASSKGRPCPYTVRDISGIERVVVV